jgi:GTP 3',8-cyclase
MSDQQLVDQFSRTISYLRLSITDRCNLRCMYCLPDNVDDKGSHLKSPDILKQEQLLTYEELLRFVGVAVEMGMTKVRLTGGEPLVRKGVLGFIQKLYHINNLEQVRLTTNGVLLQEKAEQLYRAGIRNLNVSLDTLDETKFARITGRNLFAKVWQGIQTAKEIGFRLKLNVVAMRGVNDDEFLDFASLALAEPLQIRFIEFMPVGAQSSWDKKQFISAGNIRDIIGQDFELTPKKGMKSEGPARVFQINDKQGRQGSIGFISPISHHFCDSCNRLRLTSEGKLRACLLGDQETDLRKMLRNGCSDEDIREMIRLSIQTKRKGHTLQESLDGMHQAPCRGRMSRIGG